MKVIISRKGFDSQYGKVPSPIIDGCPYSLPIPAIKMPSVTRYGDVLSPGCKIIEDLTDTKISLSSFCHLDPDLDRDLLPRKAYWRGVFGQTSSASTHL